MARSISLSHGSATTQADYWLLTVHSYVFHVREQTWIIEGSIFSHKLCAIGLNGNSWYIWQISTTMNEWSAWSHSTPTGWTFSTSTIPSVVAAQADGRPNVIVPAHGGPMFSITQIIPSGGWTSWVVHSPLSEASFTGPPALAANADGRLELYIPADSGVYHMWQETPNNLVGLCQSSAHQNRCDPIQVASALPPAVVSRLDLVVLGLNKEFWETYQTVLNTMNDDWSSTVNPLTP